MTALLGRSTSQLMGHSLPASLGGNSALGRALLARQPFSNLEMELRTRRGGRWISLAGDPIIDMGGQFQGFRGVGTDITEVRRTQERLTNLANMDVLSGLPNRGRVRQLLGEALSAAQAGNVPCAIMVSMSAAVDAITRASTATARWLPRRCTIPISSALIKTACASSGSASTSWKNKVPP